MDIRLFLRKLCIIIFWCIVWHITALLIHNPILFVSPLDVIKRLIEIVPTEQFWLALSTTVLNVFLGWLIAVLIGFSLALISDRYHIIYELLMPLVSTLKAIPVASFIVFVLIWTSSSQLSFVISILIGTPIIYHLIYQGYQSMDKQLIQMSQVYKVTCWKRFFYIELSQLYPYILSSINLGLSTCFKACIAAELVGMPLHALGSYLYQAKIYFDTASLLAYTFVIVLLSFLLERMVSYSVKRLYRLGGYHD